MIILWVRSNIYGQCSGPATDHPNASWRMIIQRSCGKPVTGISAPEDDNKSRIIEMRIYLAHRRRGSFRDVGVQTSYHHFLALRSPFVKRPCDAARASHRDRALVLLGATSAPKMRAQRAGKLGCATFFFLATGQEAGEGHSHISE